MKSIYFPHGNIPGAGVKNQGSWGWHSILEGRAVLQKGAFWLIGNGQDVRVWDDPWCLLLPNGMLQSVPDSSVQHLKVQDIINPISMTWQLSMIEQFQSDQEKHAMLSIPLSSFCKRTRSSGNMTNTKSAYCFLTVANIVQDDQRGMP